MSTVAVIIRDGPTKPWEFQTWAVNLSVACSSAKFHCFQEASFGHRQFESKIISEKDGDSKNYSVKGLAHFYASDEPAKIFQKEEVKEVEVPLSKPVGKFELKKCEWCGETLPSNGAAQFSHLRKHIKQLVEGKLLSEENGKEVRSIKLSNELINIFSEGKKQKLFS